MATIGKDFGQGGANLTPEGSGEPGLATVLRDVADDLAAGKAATIASPDAVVAAGAAPDKAEFDALVLLANEMKAALNAVQSAAIKTVKG